MICKTCGRNNPDDFLFCDRCGVKLQRNPKYFGLKPYRGIQVDKNLDVKILDKLNHNPNIKIIGTCSGHNLPKKLGKIYHDNVPEINLKYKKNPKNILKIKSNDTKIIRSKEDKTRYTIRGTQKSTQSWWKKMATKIVRI